MRPSGNDEAPPAIAIENIDLTFGDNCIYRDLSLAVPASSFFFLLGPSGCGKSTLLRLIAGLLQPTSGSIRVDGRGPDVAWEEIAFVFQSPRLVPWRNAIDNVTLAGQLRFGGSAARYRDRAADLLVRLGLERELRKLPGMLSGGERQRVAIARAFLLEPRIILMDEPFSALDLKTREHLRRELEQLWSASRRTVVFVTHDIDDALSLADKIAVMGRRPGRILESIEMTESRPRSLASPVLVNVRKRLARLLTDQEGTVDAVF